MAARWPALLAVVAASMVGVAASVWAMEPARIPVGWVELGPVPDTLPVHTVWAVALPESVAEAMEQRLLQVSDPDSASYGRYYESAERLAQDLYGEWDRSETERVVAFLRQAGVPAEDVRVHPAGDSVAVTLQAGVIGALLSTRLCEFEHAGGRVRVVRECVGRAHVTPPLLRGALAAVTPLRHFPVTYCAV